MKDEEFERIEYIEREREIDLLEQTEKTKNEKGIGVDYTMKYYFLGIVDGLIAALELFE